MKRWVRWLTWALGRVSALVLLLQLAHAIYAQHEVDPTWYDPGRTPSKVTVKPATQEAAARQTQHTGVSQLQREATRPLIPLAGSATITTQQWSLGWDKFGEPLNLNKSVVKWSVSTSRKLTVTFSLVGAKPTKEYQGSINFSCSSTFPTTFGQFPTDSGGGACRSLTRQGVTRDSAEIELGVVLTDIHRNGSHTVVVGPVPSGAYELEFFALDGAGCNVNGGAGNGSNCAVDFQSLGPFGTATTVMVP